MSGRAGAESIQARAPICISPPPLALHPRLNLYGLRVLLNSDRAVVVFSCLLVGFRRSLPKNQKFGLGVGCRLRPRRCCVFGGNLENLLGRA